MKNKLTQKQVDSIRKLFGRLSSKKIATKFNVHNKTIYDIKNGIIWNEARNKRAKISQNLKMRGEKSPSAKLKERQVIKIKSYLKEGRLTQNQIAEKYNVTSQLISLINTKKIWKHIK